MKYAIVYSSKTGNTKMLAEALKKRIDTTQCTFCETAYASEINADFYFVGFWTCRGECDQETQLFLKTLQEKKVFLFGTAGFGRKASYFEKVLQQTQKYIDSSTTLVGSFMCQGKMPIQIRQKYEEKLHSIFSYFHAKYMIKNYDIATKHPDQNDLDALILKVSKVIPLFD